MRTPLLLFGLIATAASSAGSAVAQDDSAPLEAAVRHCLAYNSTQVPKASDPSSIPPGLSEKSVAVMPVRGTGMRVFAYEGTHRHVMSCGVAIYGPVPGALRARLAALIAAARPDLQAEPKSFYDAEGPAAEQSYWGRPRAQGVTGVLLRARPPGADAPTLDVHYHNILMF